MNTRTDFRDARAARTAARGQAEQARAQAAVATAEAEQVRARTAAETAEQAEQRRDARKQRRRSARGAQVAAVRTAAPEWLRAGLWAAVIVAPLLLAWSAQQQFAAATLGFGAAAWLFPLSIEAGAWVCAYEAHRRRARGAPVGALGRWMWVLAGLAGAINLAHGAAERGLVSGCALGTLSVLGVLLHHVRTRLDAAGGHAEWAARRRAALRVALFPVLSLRALRTAVRADVDPGPAWEQAHVDRYGVTPAASRRDRALARVATQQRYRDLRRQARRGELVVLADRVVPALPTAVATSVADEISTGSQAPEQHESAALSDRASALLPQIQAAIAAGAVAANPSTKSLGRYLRARGERVGVPTLQEIRDAVSQLHPVEAEPGEGVSA